MTNAKLISFETKERGAMDLEARLCEVAFTLYSTVSAQTWGLCYELSDNW